MLSTAAQAGESQGPQEGAAAKQASRQNSAHVGRMHSKELIVWQQAGHTCCTLKVLVAHVFDALSYDFEERIQVLACCLQAGELVSGTTRKRRRPNVTGG